MTALDHNHLISRNCRDGYRSGPLPALLVTVFVSALILAFPNRAHSASFEPIVRLQVQPQAGLPGNELGKGLNAGGAHRLDRLNQYKLRLVEMTFTSNPRRC